MKNVNYITLKKEYVMGKKQQNEVKKMNEKEKFSLSVRVLSDAGFSNEEIAMRLNASRNRVGAVMAWHRHRESWS